MLYKANDICDLFKQLQLSSQKLVSIVEDLQIKVCTRKLLFLFLKPKHMVWVLKRTVSKHMFKRMSKKIFAILRYFMLNWPFVDSTYISSGGPESSVSL